MIVASGCQEKLYFDQQMSQPRLCPIAGGIAAVFSARCPDKPTCNEDAAALIPIDTGSAVLMVADGLGGVRSGEVASSIAIQAVRAALEQAVDNGEETLRSAILDGIDQANQAVQALGIGAATTLTVVEVHEGVVRPYHIGDSMILVVGQRGKVKLQTVSHSPVGFAVEAGVLDQTEAMHHQDRHVVSNVLGAPDMRVEIGSPLKLAARDTLLLASDGLFDNLHLDEIIDRVRKGPIAAATERLAKDCHQRMIQPDADQPCKPDDFTFVAFRRHP